MNGFKVGSAVCWVTDNTYKGIIWQIDPNDETAFVEFVYPKHFKMRIKLDSLILESELKADGIWTKPKPDLCTRLSAEENEELRQLYIELALATNDKKWFMELTEL